MKYTVVIHDYRTGEIRTERFALPQPAYRRLYQITQEWKEKGYYLLKMVGKTFAYSDENKNFWSVDVVKH